MKEIANEDVPIVTTEDDLASVMSRFVENEVNMLPVVDAGDNRKLLGMLRRNDVTRSYYKKIQTMKHISAG